MERWFHEAPGSIGAVPRGAGPGSVVPFRVSIRFFFCSAFGPMFIAIRGSLPTIFTRLPGGAHAT